MVSLLPASRYLRGSPLPPASSGASKPLRRRVASASLHTFATRCQHAPATGRNFPASRPTVPCPSPYRDGLRGSVAVRSAEDKAEPPAEATGPDRLGETAKANLRKAAANCKQLGWISFWTQLVLSTVSIVILLFSVAFSQSTAPTATLYLTVFGVLAGFVSTIWAFRYTRMGRSIRLYLEAKEGLLPPDEAKKIKKISKLEVLRAMNWGAFINLLGMGCTIIGLQATVGTLVAKTLTNATANPFLAGGAGSYNPVLALDVFLVQGATNTLLSHFCGIVFSMWLARSIDSNAGVATGSVSSATSAA